MPIINNEGMQEAVKLWNGTGLLKGLDEYQALHLGTLLENQRLMNENVKGSYTNESRYAFFTRVSIPLVRRMWAESPLWRMISIQTMLGPASIHYFLDKYGNVKEQEIAAKSRSLRTHIPIIEMKNGQEFVNVPTDEIGMPIVSEWNKFPNGDIWYVEGEYAPFFGELQSDGQLNKEIELVARLALDVSNEISREVFTDLSNNCETFERPWKSPVHLVDTIFYAAESTTRKVARPANWLVTSPHLVLEIVKSGELVVRPDYQSDPNKIQHVGSLGRLDVYVDPKFKFDDILMGFKGDHYQAGYFMCPYIALAEVQQTTGPIRYKLVTRYAKRLLREGAGYYAKITLDDYSYNDEAKE